MNTKTKRLTAHEDTPALEWILGSLGAVLFLIGVTFLIAEGLRGEDRPGRLEFRVDEVAAAGDGFVVRYSAHNLGTQTLADLHIKAELLDGESVIESAQGALDFLPGQSYRTAGFYFQEDPRRLRLEIRAEGYQDP